MSVEISLIARVAQTGQIKAVLEYGITENDFLSSEGRALWSILHAYYINQTTGGSVLDGNLLHMQGFQVPIIDSFPHLTLHALCFEVRKSRIKAECSKYATEFLETMSAPTADVHSAMGMLHANMQRMIALGTSGNTDVSCESGWDDIGERLELLAQGADFSIMPWPWERLQEVTGGVQEDDYIVFYGRPKSMKTWVLSKLIAHCFEQQQPCIVYTKEMTSRNVYMRVAACILRIPYDDLRLGRMNAQQKEAFYELRKFVKSHPELKNLITVLNARDAPPGGDTVSWVQGKIDKYKPRVAFIDGLYLMSDEMTKKGAADHVRVMNISRGIRNMVLATKVPCIATMQANRKAASHSNANLDEIAFSDALAQDATLAVRVVADKVSPTISLAIGGSREFKLHGIRIHGVPATNFEYHSELSEKDVENAKKQDDAEAAKENGDKAKAAKKKENVGGSARKPVVDETMKAIDTQLNTMVA